MNQIDIEREHSRATKQSAFAQAVAQPRQFDHRNSLA
jgi:hypothetical protein